MRINVIGDSSVAKTLRSYLESQGHKLSATRATYTLRIEPGSSTNIVLEGAPGPLADEARRAIGEMAVDQVEWRPQEKQSRLELRVVARGDAGDGDDAVERGLLRAILRLASDRRRNGWLWSRP